MLALLLAAWTLSATAWAGTDVEVFGGLVLDWPSIDSVYDASYTPSSVTGINTLFETPDRRSHASQSVTLQGQSGLGFGVGVNVYPGRILGVQLRVDASRADLTGTNPSHDVTLVYDSIAFPSSDPVVRTASYSFDVPDTAGRLVQRSVSLDAVARWRAGPRVSGSVSGGLSYFRLRAEALEVGAFAAWLGGHAVLFSESYRMSLETETADTVGLNLGADVAVALGGRASLYVDGRWFFGPKAAAPVHLGRIVSDNVVSVPVSRLESFLALPDLELDPRALRLQFGVKLAF